MVLPFAIEGMSVRGRLARLGPAISDILNRHDYPLPVSQLLGESLMLAAMLGTALKLEGRFTVQTSSDGPVDFLIADMTHEGGLRGYAHFDAQRVAALTGSTKPTLAELMGKGSMALTVDQGPGRNSYQGVVPLEGASIAACGEDYFLRSEQLPTLIKLVVAQSLERNADGAADGGWRAGGIMIQHMPADGGYVRDLDPGDAPAGSSGTADEAEDENWNRAQVLMATVEDHELVDPTLTSEQLLYRLYHEDGVRAFTPHDLSFSCRCSQDYIAGVLRSFGPTEMADMRTDEGRIEVRCEFCSTTYDFDPAEFAEK